MTTTEPQSTSLCLPVSVLCSTGTGYKSSKVTQRAAQLLMMMIFMIFIIIHDFMNNNISLKILYHYI